MHFSSFSWVSLIILKGSLVGGWTPFMFLWLSSEFYFLNESSMWSSKSESVCVETEKWSPRAPFAIRLQHERQKTLCLSIHDRTILQQRSTLWRAVFRLTAPAVKLSAGRQSLNWAPVGLGFYILIFLLTSCEMLDDLLNVCFCKTVVLVKPQVSGQTKP